MTRTRSWLVGPILAATLAACGGSEELENETGWLRLYATRPVVMVRETVQVDVVHWEDDRLQDSVVRWTSDDPTIVTVDDAGKVTAVGAGTVTVRASVDGGPDLGEAVGTIDVHVVGMGDLIDGLFFQRGPYENPYEPGCPFDNATWDVFPFGTHLIVQLGPRLSELQRRVMREAVADALAMTQDKLTAEVVEVARRPPTLEVNHLLVTVDPELTRSWARRIRAPGGRVTERSEISLAPRAGIRTVYHEVGHAILGLCHVLNEDLGRYLSVMSYDSATARFSSFDFRANVALYTSGLEPGASRQDLIDAGVFEAP